MEETDMRKTIFAGILVAATAGTALLSGSALADSGGAGTGGTATNNCLNVGIPILSGLGVAGTGIASAASCAATANGTGGNG
jgi:hypothetical protein